MSESEVIEQIDPNKAVAIFTGGLDDILTKIATDLKDFTPDISTEKGRKEIKSRAYKASLCKGKLDDMAEQLTEDAKKRVKSINADRDRAREFLDNLRDDIRKPVDDWDNAEKDRVAAHEAAIAEMEAFGVVPNGATSDFIAGALSGLEWTKTHRDWEEFALRASNVYDTIGISLEQALVAARKYESEQSELAILRAEKLKRDAEEAERQRIDREAQIASEAAEKARKDAEDEAARKAREAADKAAAEIAAAAAAEERARQAEIEAQQRAARAEREAAEAEQRRVEAVAKAEADRIAAAEQAERDRVAAAEKAEAERIAAEERARIAQEAAVEAERKRAADAKAAEDAATAKREADTAHRKKINNEALQALAALDCVLGEIPAKQIVIAIAEGKIPNVFIRY